MRRRLLRGVTAGVALAVASGLLRTVRAAGPGVAASGAAASSATAAGAALPVAFHRNYRLYWGAYPGGMPIGRAEVSLEIDAGRYRARLHEKGGGVAGLLIPSLTQTSAGRIDARGFRPERYTERRGDDAERVILFDAAGGEIRRGDGDRLGDWRAEIQDRLSVTLQLGVLARLESERFAPGRWVEVPVATFSTVHAMRFQSAIDESLALPAGSVRALRLTRAVVDPVDDERFDLWLSLPAMLPERLRIADAKGRVLDQVRVD